MKQSKKITVDLVVFVILWGLYTASMLLLFHRQTVHYGGGYESDMKSYVLYIQGVDSGNPYSYPLMFWVARLFSLVLVPEKSVALAVTVLNSLTPLGLKVFTDRYLDRKGLGDKKLLSTLLLFAVLFVSMLFWPFSQVGRGYRYKGVFSPNPFHNATYLAARGFAVVSFFSFLELLESFRAKEDVKKVRWQYILFAVSLLLATMTKPSFTLGFLVAAGVMVLIFWIRQGMGEWKRYVYVGLAVVPTFLDLLYQYRGVFTGQDALGSELGIGFGWLDAWHSATEHVPKAVVLGLFFPLVVLICNLRELKRSRGYSFTWAMMTADFLLCAGLYEKGWRMWHMNFAWGYMYGMFFVFVISALLLLEHTVRKRQKVWVLALQWGAFALHLLCGIVYFAGIIRGGSYV